MRHNPIRDRSPSRPANDPGADPRTAAGTLFSTLRPPAAPHRRVRSPTRSTPGCESVLSLFTGAGGLDLGLEAAGFKTTLCVENDFTARETLKLHRPDWRLAENGDVLEVAPARLLEQAGLKRGQLAMLAGGPPCQPFSKSGYWSTGDAKRMKDPRAKTLNAYLNVVRAALPEVLLLENVKGLAYAGKDEGVRLLRKELAYTSSPLASTHPARASKLRWMFTGSAHT